MSTAAATDGTSTNVWTGWWPTCPAASKPVATTPSIPSASAVSACRTLETAWKWSIPESRMSPFSP